MPLPESYTEDQLAAFMVTELTTTATALGWTDESPEIFEAVQEVAAIIGTPIADVTDVAKLRTIARWYAWQTAQSAAASSYDLSSGRSGLKRSQWFEMISRRLLTAENAALQYSEVQARVNGAYSTAYVSTIYTAGSPYSYQPVLFEDLDP